MKEYTFKDNLLLSLKRTAIIMFILISIWTYLPSIVLLIALSLIAIISVIMIGIATFCWTDKLYK